jgi:glycine cleavage system H protein
MDVPEHLKYTKEHEWVRDDGDGTVRMGITGHAQDALGDIVYFEPPAEGMSVEQGIEFSVVESVKAVSDVYAPVSGTIVEVNELLDETPEVINESPYDEGWLVRIELSAPAELDDLMDADEYREFLESE